MNTKKELIQAVASFFDEDDASVCFLPMNISGSMSSKIEDGLDESIFRLKFLNTGKTVIAKLKNNSFIANVGETMNVFESETFREKYAKGYGLFYTRDCYRREKYVYSLLDASLHQYLPKYYGSIDVGKKECLHLMEDLEICHSPIDKKQIIDFLSDLHIRYMSDSISAIKMCINIPTIEDYENGISISHELFGNIRKLYPDFPEKILKELVFFYGNPEGMFTELHSFPLTVCHGDFAVKNLTFLRNRLSVYDWELATFNNPEFDLVSFLIFYPDALDDKTVNGIIDGYCNRILQKRGMKAFDYNVKNAIGFNVKLLMCSRFHAMMNIATRVDMPFMRTSIKNWLFLYRRFISSGEE